MRSEGCSRNRMGRLQQWLALPGPGSDGPAEHTPAQWRLRAAADAGHVKLETTSIHTHVATDLLREVINPPWRLPTSFVFMDPSGAPRNAAT
jgi:hypothetical protein